MRSCPSRNWRCVIWRKKYWHLLIKMQKRRSRKWALIGCRTQQRMMPNRRRTKNKKLSTVDIKMSPTCCLTTRLGRCLKVPKQKGSTELSMRSSLKQKRTTTYWSTIPLSLSSGISRNGPNNKRNYLNSPLVHRQSQNPREEITRNLKKYRKRCRKLGSKRLQCNSRNNHCLFSNSENSSWPSSRTTRSS